MDLGPIWDSSPFLNDVRISVPGTVFVMKSVPAIRRLIVCVDGTWYGPDGTVGKYKPNGTTYAGTSNANGNRE